VKTTTRPNRSHDNSQTASEYGHNQAVTFHERAGLAISIVALVLAGIAGGVLLMMPALIDAKVQAGMAKASNEAHDARVDSRVALDKVEEVRVQLAAKGIVTKIE